MTDILDRMAQADPAADLGLCAVLPERARTLAGETIERADAEVVDDAGARPAETVIPLRRRRRRLVAVAAAATLAFGVVAFPIAHEWGPDGTPGLTTHGSAAEAAELLHAAAAITPQDPKARPGQFWKITTQRAGITVNGDGSTTRGTSREVAYVSVDGSSPTVTQVVDVEAGGDRPKSKPEAWVADVAPNERPGSWLVPNPEYLASLPRETKALRARLYEASAGQGLAPDGNAFVFAYELLRTGMVPADLRASLYRVLADIPGVQVTDRAATVGGRPGVAIGRMEVADGYRTEIVIDPATGTLVGERSIVAADVGNTVQLPLGTVESETTVTRRLVDEVPASVRASARCQMDVYPDRIEPTRC